MLARAYDRWRSPSDDQPIVIVDAPVRGTVRQSDVRRPSRWIHLLGRGHDWQHVTESQPNLAGRKMPWPRGRGLGGSSLINAMIWMPPCESDLRLLSESGLNARELGKAVGHIMSSIEGESPRWLSPVAAGFLDAAGGREDIDASVYRRFNRDGRRWTTADLLADEAFARRVEVVPALVRRLLVKDNRVCGWVSRDPASGQEASHVTESPIVLCAGAVQTPRLLLATDELRESNAQIGQNLHDHLLMPVVFGTHRDHSPRAEDTMQSLARWQHAGTGPMTCNLAECGGFSSDDVFQWHVTPTDYLRYPAASAHPACTLGVSLTRPRSRGRVSLRERSLRIDAGYLTDASDATRFIEGVARSRELAAEAPLHPLIRSEIVPGRRRDNKAAVLASVRRYAQTLYHPGGTCALGSVVDGNFQFLGCENLFVVDASVLPEPTRGNPSTVLLALAMLAGQKLAGS